MMSQSDRCQRAAFRLLLPNFTFTSQPFIGHHDEYRVLVVLHRKVLPVSVNLFSAFIAMSDANLRRIYKFLAKESFIAEELSGSSNGTSEPAAGLSGLTFLHFTVAPGIAFLGLR